MQPKISVIVPICNVEDYLRPCLESLASQTLQELEIILLNDGSTDGSAAIIDEFAARDSRIIAVHKENEGYGRTCNRGMDMASGEYIAILESDDFINADMYERLYACATSLGADVVKSPFNDCFDGGAISLYPYAPYAGETIPQGRLYSLRECSTQIALHQSIWSAIYKRSYMNEHNIRFLEVPGAGHVDIRFAVESVAFSDKLAWVDTPFYNYRVLRPDSSTATYNIAQNLLRYTELHDYLKEYHADLFRVIAPDLLSRETVGLWRYYRRQDFTDEEFEGWLALLADYSKADIDAAPLIHDWERDELKRLPAEREGIRDWIRLEKAQADIAKARIAMEVVVTCYDPSGLQATVDSLKVQTFNRSGIIVLLPEGVEHSASLPRNTIVLDGGTVAELKNKALDAARGEAVVFCNAGDIFEYNALESMFMHIAIDGADVVLGTGKDVGSMRPYIEMVYGDMTVQDDGRLEGPGNEGTFLFNKQLASQHDLSKFEPGLLRVVPSAVWMYSLSLVRENGIAVAEEGPLQDWAFRMGCLLAARKVMGCDELVCRVHRFHSMEQLPHDFTRRKDEELEQSLAAVDNVVALFEAGLERQIADGASPQLQGAYMTAPAVIRRWELVYLLEQYIRRRWQLSSQGWARLKQIAQSLWEGLAPEEQRALMYVNREFEGELFDHFDKKPFIAFCIHPSCSEQLAAEHVAMLLLQDFPFFKVMLPAKYREALSSFAAAENVFFVELDEKGDWMEQARALADSEAICFLEDPTFWADFSLRRAWQRMQWERCDALFARPVALPGAPLLRTMYMVYEEERCYLGQHDYYNAFDNGCSNKFFMLDKLTEQGFAFTGDVAADVQRAYRELVFAKDPEAMVPTRLGDSFFLGRVPKGQGRKFMPRFLMHRIGEGVLQERWQRHRQHKAEAKVARGTSKGQLRSQVAFYSVRGGNGLPPNLKKVADALDCKKLFFVDPLPHSYEYQQQVRDALTHSRVVVTDEYIHELAGLALEPFAFSKDQHVIQLWHAAGAFKKFGLDCFGVSCTREQDLHRYYEAVMVSAEGVRNIYAGAFGIAPDKVLAYGVPRTDDLLDARRAAERTAALYKRFPQLEGTGLILYTPTFRQEMHKIVPWDMGIDWEQLDRRLQVCGMQFVLKQHPLDPTEFDDAPYSNIHLINDADVNDLIAVCELLITDYSSVIFEAALLDKRMLFYCPDFDEYERDFYLDFPEDLPGKVVYDADMLGAEIEEALQGEPDPRLAQFKEEYMGACDGHATERIAAYIRERL